MRVPVPVVACVIGEGSSGGALAIGVADRVLMQQNAVYTVISPEGCAAILWKDAGEAKRAAAALRPTAEACLALGVVDAIVPEPSGGAHRDHARAAELLADAIQIELEVIAAVPPTQRRAAPAGEVPQHGRIPGVAPRWPVAAPVTRRLNRFEAVSRRRGRALAAPPPARSIWRRRPNTAVFVLAALALVALAWLVGVATEQLGESSGPKVGGS